MSNPIVVATRTGDALHDGTLSPLGLVFVGELSTAFVGRIEEALGGREAAPAETAALDLWRCTAAARPSEGRVELVGPADEVTVLAALRAAPDAFVADLDGATAPTWPNIVAAQTSLRRCLHGQLGVPARGTQILLRPRALHLLEHHVLVDGLAVPAALFDAGLFLFHGAAILRGRPCALGLSLSRMRSAAEARLWNDVLRHCERALRLAPGAIKVTVRIDRIEAALGIDAILDELRARVIEVSCDRSDYLRDVAASLGDAEILPPRTQLDNAPFLLACARRVIEAARRRGLPAIAPLVEVAPELAPGSPAGTRAVFARIVAESRESAGLGFDGVRVGVPSLVEMTRIAWRLAKRESRPPRAVAHATAREDLLSVPRSPITVEDVRTELRAGLLYLEAWLGGHGRIVDARTVEEQGSGRLVRARLWQWVNRRVRLDDGGVLSASRFLSLLDDEARQLDVTIFVSRLFSRLCLDRRLAFSDLAETIPFDDPLDEDPPCPVLLWPEGRAS